MAVWSTLVRSLSKNVQKTGVLQSKLPLKNANNLVALRNMSHTMVVRATSWQWDKTKDYFHFYFMLAAIPLSVLTFCVNVFVGPATLSPIPENYEPKYWEYYRHPITRFLARYVYSNPQKDYEKTLHVIFVESEVKQLRELEKKVWDLQAERQDFRYNYFLPVDTFQIRETREANKHALIGADLSS